MLTDSCFIRRSAALVDLYSPHWTTMPLAMCNYGKHLLGLLQSIGLNVGKMDVTNIIRFDRLSEPEIYHWKNKSLASLFISSNSCWEFELFFFFPLLAFPPWVHQASDKMGCSSPTFLPVLLFLFLPKDYISNTPGLYCHVNWKWVLQDLVLLQESVHSFWIGSQTYYAEGLLVWMHFATFQEVLPGFFCGFGLPLGCAALASSPALVRP